MDKGIRELIAAFSQLQREHADAHLLLVGAFERHQPLPHALELLITTNPRVHITGFVDDPAPYYSILDVLALPTHREGFGLVAAEAAAMEVPVVATRVTGCVDAVRDGVTGTLVPPRDASALATAIAEYLRDADRRRLHGLSGRIRMLQEFQPADVRDALWDQYNTQADFSREGPEASQKGHVSTYAAIYKRWCDVALAATALLVLSPLMALVALLVRWRLGSPVIFWQQRPGRGGKLFWMPKFRSMTSANDNTGKLLPDEQRLTRFGRMLRATSLDELPELWCVLRGEMSLIGPRPLLPEYLPRYTLRQSRRHELRPGITGWAQVNGRNALAWDERFEHDVWYVEHCSPSLDARILWRTFWQVAARRGISMSGHATAAPFDGPSSQHDQQPVALGSATGKSVVVLGAGGHAKVVISALKASGWDIAAIYDDDATKHGQMFHGVEVRGPVKGLALPRSTRAVIAIGDNLLRRAIASHFEFDWIAVIHPAAWVDPSATIEPGAVVCAGAIVQPGCQIGRHAIINTLAGVDHDCRVGAFAHVAPGAHLAGGVQIGAGTLVGAGASAIPGVRVGEDTLIGAGAVVTRSIPSDVCAVGVPARVARKLPSDSNVKKWTATPQAA
jgi:sugar O-acyltransferase (sialic acid O-acetyltransferase NeuD family)